MTKAVISIGSNLGDREQNLLFAFNQIEKLHQTATLAKSEIYETDPIGGPDQNSFLNAVALIDTQLAPIELLNELRKIENASGRTREIKWGPRTLDLDIIDYQNFTSITENLSIPHPRAASRRFVIEPLIDVAPDWKISGRPVSEILIELSDQNVKKWERE